MFSFQNTKDIAILIVRSQVMALGSELMHFARFPKYLNFFNSNFKPRIVIGKDIQ